MAEVPSSFGDPAQFIWRQCPNGWQYVPTRREVAKEPPKWLYAVLIDWMWESPSELIPNSVQIAEVRSVLLARPDAADPAVVQIIAECDEYLACGT
ncbi:hypothetical protein [Pseudoxanthomonas mexicana]